MITIPYLPKPSLLEYLRTQCQVDIDGRRGAFIKALDTRLSSIDPKATADMVGITGLEIAQGSLEVFYRVHYSIWNSAESRCHRTELGPYISHTVVGWRGARGWEFAPFQMEQEGQMRNRTTPSLASHAGEQRWAL